MKALICTKCGKPRKCTSKRYTKLVEQAGGEEQLKKTYVCRDCRPKKEKKAAEEKTA